MTTRIHINRNIIQYNQKHDTAFPVCRVQEGNKVRYCREVYWDGPSKMIYRPENPLPCGAKLWIETEAEVDLIEECTYADFKKFKTKMKELGLT